MLGPIHVLVVASLGQVEISPQPCLTFIPGGSIAVPSSVPISPPVAGCFAHTSSFQVLSRPLVSLNVIALWECSVCCTSIVFRFSTRPLVVQCRTYLGFVPRFRLCAATVYSYEIIRICLPPSLVYYFLRFQ